MLLERKAEFVLSMRWWRMLSNQIKSTTKTSWYDVRRQQLIFTYPIMMGYSIPSISVTLVRIGIVSWCWWWWLQCVFLVYCSYSYSFRWFAWATVIDHALMVVSEPWLLWIMKKTQHQPWALTPWTFLVCFLISAQLLLDSLENTKSVSSKIIIGRARAYQRYLPLLCVYNNGIYRYYACTSLNNKYSKISLINTHFNDCYWGWIGRRLVVHQI